MGQDGGITPEAALAQAMQDEGMSGNPDFSNPTWTASAAGMVAAGQIPAASFSPNCAGQPPASNMNLLSTVSGISLAAAGATEGIMIAMHTISAVTGAIAGAATMGAGAIISVIMAIFAHHAAAVKQEQQLGCAAINAFNNAISVIDSAVAAGQTTPDAAASSMDTLIGQVDQYVSPSVKHNPCNADCELTVLVKAIVLYKKALYNGMAAVSAATADNLNQQAQTLQQQAATAAANGDTAMANTLNAQAAALQQQAGTAASSGTPSWMWLAAAGIVGAFLFLR
jgi:hypothetical protein